MTTADMTVTDEMRENAQRIGQKVFRDYKGSLKGSVTAAINAELDDLAMRAPEPTPRSDDARLSVARQWLPGNLSKGGGLAEHVLAAIDAVDPLRNLSGDGIEAACREFHPGWDVHSEPFRIGERRGMSRAIAAYLAAEGRVTPDIWEPPEQCETPAVCKHQGMCEKFMAGKCTASAEPSERAVLGALARFTLHIRGDAVKVLPEDNATLHRAAEWKP